MAVRARLVAPPPAPDKNWQWHVVKSASIPASALFMGDRRMEAETYLSSGYGIRLAIESKPRGWVPFHQLARVEQPGRLKGILVSPEYGKPFLAATQVFDVRPIPRKFLAIEKMDGAMACYVEDGTILVTRSGSVGRATVAHSVHKGIVVSDDLLRVKAIDERNTGWIYAYLRAQQTRAMTKGAQYGHIIKHLEISHLDAIPIPTVDKEIAADFTKRLTRILELRNEGHRLTLEAEHRFEAALGIAKIEDWGELGFEVQASKALMRGRRRMEASFHNPGASSIRKHLGKNGRSFTSLTEAGYDVWLPSRFRRVPAEDGVLLVDSADLTEVNPDLTKTIADGDFGDSYRGRVKAGWILMARSGQTYGIIGTAVLAGADLEDKVISDHVMRIKPKTNATIPPGYVVTALAHPLFGRPLVKSLAYGSSIPEIEVADMASHEIVRLEAADENVIAGLAEASAKARATADILEREITSDAETILKGFIGNAAGHV
jgi:hypothetical protein